jgi:hypothetical protein
MRTALLILTLLVQNLFVVGEEGSVNLPQAPTGTTVPNAFNGLPKFFIVPKVALFSRNEASFE